MDKNISEILNLRRYSIKYFSIKTWIVGSNILAYADQRVKIRHENEVVFFRLAVYWT